MKTRKNHRYSQKSGSGRKTVLKKTVDIGKTVSKKTLDLGKSVSEEWAKDTIKKVGENILFKTPKIKFSTPSRVLNQTVRAKMYNPKSMYRSPDKTNSLVLKELNADNTFQSPPVNRKLRFSSSSTKKTPTKGKKNIPGAYISHVASINEVKKNPNELFQSSSL